MAEPDSHGQHVREAGETIHDLRDERRRDLPKRDRVVQSAVAWIGRPWSIAIVAAFIVLWVALNVVLRILHLAFDTDTFARLNLISQIASLLLVLTILSGQNSLRTLEEERDRLTLQMSLIVDKKISEVLKRLGTHSELEKPTDLHHAAQALHEAEERAGDE